MHYDTWRTLPSFPYWQQTAVQESKMLYATDIESFHLLPVSQAHFKLLQPVY